eukprot:SAG31_NODE_4162_length_3521_cov_31.856224_1_plen_116_part_10
MILYMWINLVTWFSGKLQADRSSPVVCFMQVWNCPSTKLHGSASAGTAGAPSAGGAACCDEFPNIMFEIPWPITDPAIDPAIDEPIMPIMLGPPAAGAGAAGGGAAAVRAGGGARA